MKWHTQERDPEGLPRVVRNGQVPAYWSPVVWDAGSVGASGQRPAVDEHGERCPLASRILRTRIARRKSRRCCWCGICAGCRRGPPPGARDAARRGTLWDFVGDEHRAADGSIRYA
jgi:hypothetical protein